MAIIGFLWLAQAVHGLQGMEMVRWLPVVFMVIMVISGYHWFSTEHAQAVYGLPIEKYNLKEIMSEEMNTMSCEQTFACLLRFKKILSAMPQTHHHFYLHRMVQRRNIHFEVLC